MLAPWKKSYDKPRQHIKKHRHQLTDKSPHSESYAFSRSHVWMWDLDHNEGRLLKNWCFQIVGLEKTLESSLDSKEIKPANPTHGKDPDAKKDWGQEKKRQQRMRQLDGITDSMEISLSKHLGDDERQGSLVCCSSWSCKELTRLSHWTTTTHNIETNKILLIFYLCKLLIDFPHLSAYSTVQM